jgi:hypothetical protein
MVMHDALNVWPGTIDFRVDKPLEIGPPIVVNRIAV